LRRRDSGPPPVAGMGCARLLYNSN
jgi:hypothetical protein